MTALLLSPLLTVFPLKPYTAITMTLTSRAAFYFSYRFATSTGRLAGHRRD